jgi:hypothetical protein
VDSRSQGRFSVLIRARERSARQFYDLRVKHPSGGQMSPNACLGRAIEPMANLRCRRLDVAVRRTIFRLIREPRIAVPN